MDLATWMTQELDDMTSRLRSSVTDIIPTERHKEQVHGGGSTVTSLMFHIARHQDVAINAVVRGTEQTFDSFAPRLASESLAASAGLEEAESQQLTGLLDSAEVIAYYAAVCGSTSRWLVSLGASDLDIVPDSAARLTAAGVNREDVPWLFNMWESKPVSFHVRWEAIGHGVTHTGEMVSMRNRMGLSPF